MYATTKPGIMKIGTILTGLIVTIVGCEAHFNSIVKKLYDFPGFTDECKNTDGCPGYTKEMEQFFVAIVIICLILSVISLILGFVMDLKGVKNVDASYHAIAGCLIFLAGVLMIVSAVQWQIFMINSVSQSNQGFLNQGLNYPYKVAAGGLALINAINYFVTSVAIFKS